ncbi:hypothetical protein KV102_09820 [Mumia sp. zg.B53]|uniref:hypothetical protein n=1 Tax=unclassified Mumia TaxID=2621872 RepID=UPI001C6EDA16|nr:MULTISPECIES: hypothetical protein [unclassified Mumia]MBW9210523.1 hypothetical protein [Mumia sp. zg.B21]MBW9215135.1 hypothetical protein [Mumia sp. zg.B53]
MGVISRTIATIGLSCVLIAGCGSAADDAGTGDAKTTKSETTTSASPSPEKTAQKTEATKEPDDDTEDSDDIDVAEIERIGIEAEGGRPLKSMCDAAYTHWSCFYDGMKAMNSDDVRVSLTTDGGWSDADLDALAEDAARWWIQMTCEDTDKPEMVVVEVNGIDRADWSRDDSFNCR